MKKSVIGLQKLVLSFLMACSWYGNVQAQDITMTDSAQYKSTGINASLNDDKLVNNTVVVDLPNSQQIKDFICFGAKSDQNDNNYDLHGNTVQVKDGQFTRVSIFGGYSDYRFVDNNNVKIDNGSFERNKYGINGGYSVRGTVYNNGVEINNGNFDGVDISGGYSEYGSISKNHVIINNGTFNNYMDVYGGNSKNIGIVSDNYVIINNIGENYFGGIYGGFSASGLVARNNVTVKDDIYAFDVVGGYGDHDAEAAVYGNSVNVNNSDSTIYTVAGGKNYNGNVFLNSVSLADSNISGTVYGGMTMQGNAYNNNVNIKSSSVTGNVSGGYLQDSNGAGEVKNNTVIINKSDITGSVIGGYADSKASVSDNVVEIIDSNVQGNIVGGYSAGGSADNNTVVLKGSGSDMYNLEQASVTGGYSGSNTSSNNRLVLDSWQGNIKNISGTDEIVFGKLNWQDDGTVIKITGQQATDLSGTSINGNWISFDTEDPKQHIGESMHLIQNDAGLIFNEAYDEKVKVEFLDGIAHEVYGEVYNNAENNSIDFTIDGRKQSEQLKLMTYNRNIGMALVNQGSELLDDSLRGQAGLEGINTFAAVQGNASTYDVGGEAKLNGWSGIVGVADTKKLADGKLRYGIFYENGQGNYRDYNTFDGNFFRFDGSAVYNGGGLAARYSWDNGFYTQAALRAGTLKNELKNGLADKAGNNYGYQTVSSYYGADLSLGKIFKLNDKTELDVYGGFYYTHFNDSNFTITGSSFSNDFHFGEVESKRLRAGGRIVQQVDDNFKVYYGAAYEYELDGRSNISTQGEYIDDDGGLRGGTVIGELGISYGSQKKSPWVIEAVVRGYGGNREGFSANIQANYSF